MIPNKRMQTPPLRQTLDTKRGNAMSDKENKRCGSGCICWFLRDFIMNALLDSWFSNNRPDRQLFHAPAPTSPTVNGGQREADRVRHMPVFTSGGVPRLAVTEHVKSRKDGATIAPCCPKKQPGSLHLKCICLTGRAEGLSFSAHRQEAVGRDTPGRHDAEEPAGRQAGVINQCFEMATAGKPFAQLPGIDG